jgi:phosphinothricin acetyltransferase
MTIITATEHHFESIISIYNWAIINTTATLDEELKTLENYKEFLSSFTRLPLIVSLSEEQVSGWACVKQYSDKSAYDTTVELSVYVDPSFHGQGIATKLMEEVISRAKALGLHSILSRITTESASSIHLHRKFGFSDVGTMNEVGFKFDKFVDVLIMQKILK